MRIYAEAEAETDTERRKGLARHAVASEAEARIRAMMSLASTEPEVVVEAAELDSDPYLLNVATGTIDLRTGKLQRHDRGDLITKIAPVEYDPDAFSELWEETLALFLPDREVRDFLQRAVGYSICGDTREEVLFFPYGPKWAGKTTILEAIKTALGDYAATADFNSFLRSRGGEAGRPRSDIVRLAGVRFVGSVEVDEGRRLAEGLVKLLTGGDTVTARSLYREEIEFKPQFKLWLAANHRPKASDDDDALWRRILQVPFSITISDADRDPGVKALLRDTAESGPAILAWAVKGCLEWQKHGLAVPGAVREATDDYRREMDPLTEFLQECCDLDPGLSVSRARLLGTYQRWAHDCGEDSLSAKEFTRRIRNLGAREGTVDRERGWSGIGLKTEQRLGRVE